MTLSKWIVCAVHSLRAYPISRPSNRRGCVLPAALQRPPPRRCVSDGRSNGRARGGGSSSKGELTAQSASRRSPSRLARIDKGDDRPPEDRIVGIYDVAFPRVPSDVPVPRPPESFVADPAGYLTPAETSRLNNLCRELREDTGAELAVAALEDLHPESDYLGRNWHDQDKHRAYGEFARELFDHWGVGRKDVNDGALIVVFRSGKRVETVTGRGLALRSPLLWDKGLKMIQEDRMVPSFVSGDYDEGILAGAQEIARAVRHSSPVSSAGGGHGDGGGGGWEGFGGGRSQKGGPGTDASLFPPLALLVLFFTGALALDEERSARRCRECGAVAEVVAEGSPSDIERALVDLLTPCEKIERRLGSVSFRLLHCSRCGKTTAGRRWNALSAAKECHECGCCSKHRIVRETIPSTTSQPGERVIETSCENCGRKAAWVESTPRLRRRKSTSTRGGSGGSGFGGGTSSGGGSASSSW